MKNKVFFIFIILIAIFLTNQNLGAQTITSAQSGNWSDPNTWVNGNVPTSANDVLIASGHTVTVDVSTAECKNVSFGATTSKLAMAEGSVLSVYGNFTLYSTSHTAFSSWAPGAKLRFTGSTPQSIVNLNTSATSTTQTFFMEIQVDKSGDTLKIPKGDRKLNIGTSLEIINGVFCLDSSADIQGRTFNGDTSTTPTITVYSGGNFSMIGGASHIGSGRYGTPRPPIGKVIIYGSMNVVTTSTNRINFSGIDIESGGTLTISTGASSRLFAPGIVTIKNGGTLINTTTTNVWQADTSGIDLKPGGVFRTNSSTTPLPSIFINNGTVRYGRSDVQTIIDMNYYRLEISFSGTKTWTLEANRTISDSLEINNSAPLVITAASPRTVTVNGTLRLTSGSLDNSSANITLALANGATISRATGTITNSPNFLGLVNVRYTSTVSDVTTGPELPTSPSALNNLQIITGERTITLNSDITVNSTLILSNGTFNNSSKTLTLANNAIIRRATAILTAAPAFGSSVNLEYISTVSDITTGYEVPSSTSVLNNLTMNTSKNVTLNSDITVNGVLNLTNGLLILGPYNLTLSPSATTEGTPSASSMIITNGSGEFRKQFSGAGSFTFHIGDNTGTVEYSPVTLYFTSGTFNSTAYAGVKVVNAKHPQNNSPNDYINRYWSVTQNGISDFSCNANFVYTDADIVGTESNLVLGKLDGQWDLVGNVDAETNTCTAIGLTSLSDFTAGEPLFLPVQLSSFTGNIISNGKVKLEWETISETYNFGFYVEKFNTVTNAFLTVSEFIPGAGTTLQPQKYSWIDENAVEENLQYRLKQIDLNGLSHYFGPLMLNPTGIVNQSVPAVFKLEQNYPNPFNPSTTISFTLDRSDFTTLKIYNILGNEIAVLFKGYALTGKKYDINFDATDLPSGIYLYQLISGKNVETKKMLILK